MVKGRRIFCGLYNCGLHLGQKCGTMILKNAGEGRKRNMVILIGGASHTGKTLLAQKLLEKYSYPYLSVDHLKMGLIRSGQTDLTPMDDDKLGDYLWPIVREMVKTAIENGQNLIVEGCYIPFDWKRDFNEDYLQHIRYVCLVMSRNYIQNHFSDILTHANAIEQRLDDSDLSAQRLMEDNERNLQQCMTYDCPYLLIDGDYAIELSGWDGIQNN
jgi:adenylate kinase family enzyme